MRAVWCLRNAAGSEHLALTTGLVAARCLRDTCAGSSWRGPPRTATGPKLVSGADVAVADVMHSFEASCTGGLGRARATHADMLCMCMCAPQDRQNLDASRVPTAAARSTKDYYDGCQAAPAASDPVPTQAGVCPFTLITGASAGLSKLGRRMQPRVRRPPMSGRKASGSRTAWPSRSGAAPRRSSCTSASGSSHRIG